MNKLQILEMGLELIKENDISKMAVQYESWKAAVLKYADKRGEREQIGISLHMVNTPYEPEREKISRYRSCIQKGIDYVAESKESICNKRDILERLIANFSLYLKLMFMASPGSRSTLKPEILSQIKINNEYDIQHMMYALIKLLYPLARRETIQETGYGAVRPDIQIEEIDTVIEIKCTREDHSERKLLHELGEDGYFYQCSRLIIYIYDRCDKIRDADNFIKALERSKEQGGKTVHVYIDQPKKLI